MLKIKQLAKSNYNHNYNSLSNIMKEVKVKVVVAFCVIIDYQAVTEQFYEGLVTRFTKHW